MLNFAITQVAIKLTLLAHETVVPVHEAAREVAGEVAGDAEPEAVFNDISAVIIVQGLLAVLFAYGLLWIIGSIAGNLSEKVPRRNRLLVKQMVPFLKGLVLVVTLSYLMRLYVNLTGSNLFALTGVVAVTIGFAFKDYASSIIAGVVNLIERPFRMGDRIQIGEYYGEVVDYGLRGLQLQTPDDNAVTIPHSATWSEPISNANSGQLEAQVVTAFYFAHEADINRAVDILYQAAYSSRYTQLKLPVVVIASEEPWATKLLLKSYPMDARNEFVYKTDLIMRVKEACGGKASGDYRLPYPQVPLAGDEASPEKLMLEE
ncbi:MAG: mechanosensitive ion channel family protein [Cyanobacteria bacterium J06598_3]